MEKEDPPSYYQSVLKERERQIFEEVKRAYAEMKNKTDTDTTSKLFDDSDLTEEQKKHIRDFLHNETEKASRGAGQSKNNNIMFELFKKYLELNKKSPSFKAVHDSELYDTMIKQRDMKNSILYAPAQFGNQAEHEYRRHVYQGAMRHNIELQKMLVANDRIEREERFFNGDYVSSGYC